MMEQSGVGTAAPIEPGAGSDQAALQALEGSRPADFLQLTKPRLSLLAAIVAAGGYYMGSEGRLDLGTFLHTTLAMWLLSGGASALNMYLERDLDAKMNRTVRRPLPSGRMMPAVAMYYGILLCVVGILYLVACTNLIAGAVGAFAVASYVFVYTPLKQKTALCTVVGAFPGALPPVVGWAAARGSLDFGGWLLFAILFLWQLPHFLAIAWVFRDDYASAGMPMLTVIDPKGDLTSRQMVVTAAGLLAVSLLPTCAGLAGRVYFWTALATGLVYLCLAMRWAMRRTILRARHVFLASIIHITILFVVMMIDKVG